MRTTISVLFLLSAAAAARAQEAKPAPPPVDGPTWTVSGSLSTDFSALVAKAHNRATNPEEGFTGEFSLAGQLQISKGFSVSLRTCVGCHQVEVQEAYADIELAPTWTLRAGRFPIPFGAASRRVDPAHRESSSKPLPYIMGHMVRGEEFNNGILPAPASDNGFSLLGNFPVGARGQVVAELAATRGLEGSGPEPDFAISRDYEDSNGQPAYSVRVTWSGVGPATLGLSGNVGRYDANADLEYRLAEADLQLALGGWNLRLEAVFRSTEFRDLAGEVDESKRFGYIVQLDGELGAEWRAFLLADGLKVDDVYLSSAGPLAFSTPATTDDSNQIRRFVGGLVWNQRPGLMYKGSAEYWDLSDFADTWVLHFAVVVTF